MNLSGISFVLLLISVPIVITLALHWTPPQPPPPRLPVESTNLRVVGKVPALYDWEQEGQ
jgi:hypothetical protein